MSAETRARLRELLAQKDMTVAPFTFDCLQAKLAEQAGFQAIYMTGFGTSAARGFPDLGLLTMTEMVANVRAIANSVKIPAHRRCRHRLRQSDECVAHGARV